MGGARVGGSLSKIAEAPDKDFGPLVRERRRRRGLPILPAPSILPDLPAPPSRQEEATLAEIDRAAEMLLAADARAGDAADGTSTSNDPHAQAGATGISVEAHHPEDLQAARIRLAEQRVREAFAVLEVAERRETPSAERMQLEASYEQALATYTACAVLHTPSTRASPSTTDDSQGGERRVDLGY